MGLLDDLLKMLGSKVSNGVNTAANKVKSEIDNGISNAAKKIEHEASIKHKKVKLEKLPRKSTDTQNYINHKGNLFDCLFLWSKL